jgi:hypothetical protein
MKKHIRAALLKCHKITFVCHDTAVQSHHTLQSVESSSSYITLQSLILAAMSTTMTVTKPQATPSAQAGVMDHSIYPPIERFQTIDGLIRSHAAEHDQKPAICYPVKAAADFEEHTPAEVDRYTDITAQYYIDQGLKPAVRISCLAPFTL